jgi:uncharacterized membrane protein
MDDFVAHTMFSSLLCGVIFSIGGAIMQRYPPKNINYLYGYRTSSSMQSQERWDFAQKFSAVLMIKVGAALVAVSLLGYFIPTSELVKVITGFVLIILSAVYLFIVTEKAIKKKFKH